MKNINSKMTVTLGLLVAIQIVLSRFCSINAWNIKIGFGFVPIAVAAILYGAVPAGIVGALSDFLGAILFPIGAYFPGFTLTAFLTGIVYGVCFHKKQSIGRILGAVSITQLVLSLLLNSLWISILYHAPYEVLLGTRILQCAVLAPTEFLVIGAITKVLGFCGKRVPA